MADDVVDCCTCDKPMDVSELDFCITARTTFDDDEDYFCSYKCMLLYYGTLA
jgi:hypothetical protein